MALAPGTRLGPYEIVAPIGAGGMGEVYRARDTRLDRTVAVKVLPSADSERRQRFLREAKAIAALSHPHICVLHDVGEQAPSTDPGRLVDFIVIEYLEGETVSDRLRAGPLPAQVLLDLAIQITDALEAAHAARIVHRDLKPQNVFITSRGQAKVLDFGLAKLETDPRTATAAQASDQSTMLADVALTSPGTAMGTLAYMSPEQARGEDTDARTDLFSLGAVLYEMATGRPAFSGRTPAIIIDELLNRRPPAADVVNRTIPPGLSAVIERLMEKDRSRRYQRAADVRADLERLKSGAVVGAGFVRSGRRVGRLRAALVAAAAIVVIALGVTAGRHWLSSDVASGPIDSIAVLPFVNASGTPDADYLADGLAGTLTNNLAQVRGLRVVPRSLAARYSNVAVEPRVAGAALNARAVVTGRVIQRGDRLRVEIELIDAPQNAQLWGDVFDRPMADVLAMQEDISRAIAEGLRLHLTSEDQKGLTAGAPRDAVAFQLYLKGEHETSSRTRAGYAAAADDFDQAIARDPSYARAYAGLAAVYLWQGYWGYLPSADAYTRALAAADQAVRLDDRSADAHAALGWLNLYYRWNWTESAREYARALALDPTSATILAWHGESLSTRGRHDEAIAEVRKAVALDPLSPQLMISLGFVLSNARRFDEAVVALQAAVSSRSESTLAELDLARVYRLAGKTDLAIEHSRRMVDSADPLGPAFLGASYARAGRRAEALAIAAKMEAEVRRTHQGNFLVAIVYSSLGDKERALQWLEEAFRAHETFLPWIGVDPEFDPIRDDPRFADLIRRVGIPER